MRSVSHGHSFCFVLQIYQLNKMILRAREKEASHIDDSEGIATKDGEGKKKAVSEIEGVLLRYTREERT